MSYIELQILIDTELRQNWNCFDNYEDIGFHIFNKIYENSDLRDFQERRKNFINEYGESDYPENEQEFYIKFCNDFCGIDSIPKDIFIQKYTYAIDRLRSLENNIKICNEELKSLNKQKQQNGILTPEQKYKNKMIDYYLNENQKEKDYTLDYITNKIIEKSIKRKSMFYSILFDFPDFFNDKIKLPRLNIRNYNPVYNKFGNLPFPEYKAILNLFNENKDEYKKSIKEIIKTKDIPRLINEEVSKNHILSYKKDSILKLLKEYNDNNYFVFNNLIPLFIEGIFNDICITLGIGQKELDCSSLNDKLDLILGKLDYFFLYEYFAFNFPILRNKIAHGDLENTEDEYLANTLLLDLWSVCNFTNENELPYNVKRKKINELYAMEKTALFQFYISNKELDLNKLDDFYVEENSKLEEIKNRLFSIDFAKFIKESKHIEDKFTFFEKIKKENPSIHDEVNKFKMDILHITS